MLIATIIAMTMNMFVVVGAVVSAGTLVVVWRTTPRVEPSRAQRSHLQRISYRCRHCMHASSHDIKLDALNGQAGHTTLAYYPAACNQPPHPIHPSVSK